MILACFFFLQPLSLGSQYWTLAALRWLEEPPAAAITAPPPPTTRPATSSPGTTRDLISTGPPVTSRRTFRRANYSRARFFAPVPVRADLDESPTTGALAASQPPD